MNHKTTVILLFMNHFDLVARQWDEHPERLERSQVISAEIKQRLTGNGNLRALEYGAGTGVLSLLLQDRFSEIVMMDSSREMVKVMDEKVREAGIDHLQPFYGNLEEEPYTKGKFDVIYTLMVMHHVEQIDQVLTRFSEMLNKGGLLFITDLFQEDGSFHKEDFNGHLGFDPECLGQRLKSVGFQSFAHHHCYTMKKPILSGEIKEFPLFMLVGQR